MTQLDDKIARIQLEDPLYIHPRSKQPTCSKCTLRMDNRCYILQNNLFTHGEDAVIGECASFTPRGTQDTGSDNAGDDGDSDDSGNGTTTGSGETSGNGPDTSSSSTSTESAGDGDSPPA